MFTTLENKNTLYAGAVLSMTSTTIYLKLLTYKLPVVILCLLNGSNI